MNMFMKLSLLLRDGNIIPRSAPPKTDNIKSTESKDNEKHNLKLTHHYSLLTEGAAEGSNNH